MPPPELAEHFARASLSNPDSTYAAALFQTGWFVESLLTQTLIIHVIRTNKVPFIQSRASWPLIVTSGAIMLSGHGYRFHRSECGWGLFLCRSSIGPCY